MGKVCTSAHHVLVVKSPAVHTQTQERAVHGCNDVLMRTCATDANSSQAGTLTWIEVKIDRC